MDTFKTLAGWALGAFVMGMAFVLCASAGQARVAQAAAAVSVAHHSGPTWTQRTCSAAQAYTSHPTAGRLAVLAADSTHVAWKYLGEDVWQLVKDVRTHSRDYDNAAQYVIGDCDNGYGF